MLVAVLLLALAVPSLPGLLMTFPPVSLELAGRQYDWTLWIEHVVTVTGFGIASYLAFRGARLWALSAILMCTYVAFVATPPFVRMSYDGGFFTLTEIVLKQAASSGGIRGFYLIWNLIVLPILPALLVPLTAWLWWQTREAQSNSTMEADARKSSARRSL
jgi:hypothetical protein